MAGLILCGNLQDSERIFLDYTSYRSGGGGSTATFELDRFLQERLSIPFTIVWDGTSDQNTISSISAMDSASLVTSAKSTTTTSSGRSHHRSVIIGGGTSPHRRRPGIFAWILTRFVEERIAPTVSIQTLPSSASSSSVRRSIRHIPSNSSKETTVTSSVVPIWLSSLPLWKLPSRIPVLWNVDDIFNEESMVVFGRIVATAIFYAISLKVLLYQYGNIRDVIDFVTSTPRHIIGIIQNRVSNIAKILLFIGRLPLMILPLRRRARTSQGNETLLENQSLMTLPDDGTSKKQSDATDSHKNDTDKVDSTPDDDLRPFFFLDHVVA
jgi:hypothetical protein